jgi:co-chaperonin GroES (HSP10)
MSQLRLLRGRTLIRVTGDQNEHVEALRRAGLVAPASIDSDPRKNQNQNSLGRGVIVAMGAPALARKGGEVRPGHAVGDEVYFIGQGRERVYEVDGELLRACAQEEVVAVISGGAS